MENIATSVRITAAANALLSALAGKTGKPKAQIVEEALRDWEDRMFWAEVQQAFAASPESHELRTERELWERTVPDGLGPAESKPFGSRPVGSRSKK
jgi:predicted transcriptional regulator